MAKVFVFLEGNGANLKKGSLELLNAAKNSGREVVAGLVGPGTKALTDAAGKSVTRPVALRLFAHQGADRCCG